MKVCSKCGGKKEEVDFYFDNRRQRYCAECKKCHHLRLKIRKREIAAVRFGDHNAIFKGWIDKIGHGFMIDMRDIKKIAGVSSNTLVYKKALSLLKKEGYTFTSGDSDRKRCYINRKAVLEIIGDAEQLSILMIENFYDKDFVAASEVYHTIFFGYSFKIHLSITKEAMDLAGFEYSRKKYDGKDRQGFFRKKPIIRISEGELTSDAAVGDGDDF